MTNRELEILTLIRENSLISQKEIAERLNITRSSVGVHIASLISKGHIMGKGYIIRENKSVSVIGGCNIDILGTPENQILGNDSCPGKISYHFGGVGRNIAENMALIGIDTTLFSILGMDGYGDEILAHCGKLKIDTSNIKRSSNYNTSTYLSVLNNDGDVLCALSDMDILEELDIEYFKKNINKINNSGDIVMDTNVSESSLEYLFSNITGNIFLDTVSASKCIKILGYEDKIFLLKPNIIETEKLLKIKIRDEKDILLALNKFHDKGIKNVIITCGEKGIYYSDSHSRGRIRSKKIKVVNANGAGDSFMAGLVYGFSNGMNIKEAAKYGYLSSIITLGSNMTISDNMSIDNLEKLNKENVLIMEEKVLI